MGLMTTPRVTDWDDPARLDAEMAAEQAVIDRAYARIEAMRDAARAVSADVIESTPGGTHQARLERDVRVQVTERRLASLQVGEAGLVFGRTDSDGGESHHIGRVAISDDDNESLVVDWRAPAAEPFYRATPGLPMGLVRRRHLIVRGRRLTGLDDELLSEPRAEGDLVLVGEGALLAALERTRTGRMSDIVATIQREQDEIVRSPLAGIILVQGAPAPARRPSPSTAPPTCSTRSGSRSSGRASCSSAPTGSSCATSSRSSPLSARTPSTWPHRPTWCRRGSAAGSPTPSPGSRATPAWPGWWPRPSATGSGPASVAEAAVAGQVPDPVAG